jgi:hypothetical protein
MDTLFDVPTSTIIEHFEVLQDLPEARLDVGLAHRACMMDNQAVFSG